MMPKPVKDNCGAGKKLHALPNFSGTSALEFSISSGEAGGFGRYKLNDSSAISASFQPDAGGPAQAWDSAVVFEYDSGTHIRVRITPRFMKDGQEVHVAPGTGVLTVTLTNLASQVRTYTSNTEVL
jgi:hypothetical protein